MTLTSPESLPPKVVNELPNLIRCPCHWRVLGIVATTPLVDALCLAETVVSLFLASSRYRGYHFLGGCVMLGRDCGISVLGE